MAFAILRGIGRLEAKTITGCFPDQNGVGGYLLARKRFSAGGGRARGTTVRHLVATGPGVTNLQGKDHSGKSVSGVPCIQLLNRCRSYCPEALARAGVCHAAHTGQFYSYNALIPYYNASEGKEIARASPRLPIVRIRLTLRRTTVNNRYYPEKRTSSRVGVSNTGTGLRTVARTVAQELA